MTIQQRINQLRKAKIDLGKVLRETSREATKRAVEAAAEATPPKGGTGRVAGTDTLTGNLKASWAKDSTTEPEVSGGKYTTYLQSNVEYASYVNDGHRMDRHFVPGLYVNPASGLLEMDPGGEGGIVVGTKTFYVPGAFMTDKGKEAFQKAVEEILDGKVAELLK